MSVGSPPLSCVQRVQGLSQCVKLRKLYLYQNCITGVQGLAGLDELSTLWLNSNRITSIEVGVSRWAGWGRSRWAGWGSLTRQALPSMLRLVQQQ